MSPYHRHTDSVPLPLDLEFRSDRLGDNALVVNEEEALPIGSDFEESLPFQKTTVCRSFPQSGSIEAEQFKRTSALLERAGDQFLDGDRFDILNLTDDLEIHPAILGSIGPENNAPAAMTAPLLGSTGIFLRQPSTLAAERLGPLGKLQNRIAILANEVREGKLEGGSAWLCAREMFHISTTTNGQVVGAHTELEMAVRDNLKKIHGTGSDVQIGQ